MKESLFDIELTKAEVMVGVEMPAYWTGYINGLKRRFHGETFGSGEEHAQSMAEVQSDDAEIQERGRGYRDGYLGVVDFQDPANGIQIMRKWRDWSLDQLAEKAGVTPETAREWEVGRMPTEEELRILKKIYVGN